MAEIVCEKHNDVLILHVIGEAIFDEISKAVKQYFPQVTKHLIWNYTKGDLLNVTANDFKLVPDLSSEYFINRNGGRTAFACPNDYEYGMFRMYIAFASIKSMPYEYAVFRSFEEALKWVESSP